MPKPDRFQLIGIVTRRDDGHALDTEAAVRSFLGEQGCETLAGNELDTVLQADRCDLVIVIGGDGTLLGTARALARADIPVVGINLGRLGFLTNLPADELETGLSKLLAGGYRMEERFLLTAEIRHENGSLTRGDALNDVIFSSGTLARMTEFEMYVGDQFVSRQRSDGLIVSTPTGSTAYALSAGGPIMHPDLNAIALVAMYPHTLSNRPLVVAGDSRIRLIPLSVEEQPPRIICDGQLQFSVGEGEEVVVYKKQQTLKLLYLPDQDFFAGCRNKLGWGTRPS